MLNFYRSFSFIPNIGNLNYVETQTSKSHIIFKREKQRENIFIHKLLRFELESTIKVKIT